MATLTFKNNSGSKPFKNQTRSKSTNSKTRSRSQTRTRSRSQSSARSRSQSSARSRSQSKSQSKSQLRSRSFSQNSRRNSKSNSKSISETKLNKAKEIMRMLYNDAKDEDMITLEEAQKIEYDFEKEYEEFNEKIGGAGAALTPVSFNEAKTWAINGAWPGNYGCRGNSTKIQFVMPGINFDRFGIKYGAFLGKTLDNYVSRSMNRISMAHEDKYKKYYTHAGNHLLPIVLTYHTYALNQPIITYSCTAAKAFDKPGGAKQFIVPAIPENVLHGIPLDTSRDTSELIDPNVGPTRFYKIDYLLRKGVLTDKPIDSFPRWK